jgi:hypothetical protein
MKISLNSKPTTAFLTTSGSASITIGQAVTNPLLVIASVAKQSRSRVRRPLDCRASLAMTKLGGVLLRGFASRHDDGCSYER